MVFDPVGPTSSQNLGDALGLILAWLKQRATFEAPSDVRYLLGSHPSLWKRSYWIRQKDFRLHSVCKSRV
jgi:hypothetical protein